MQPECSTPERVLRENISSIDEIRRRARVSDSRQMRIANDISGFAGSMAFVYVHVVWFGAWIVINLGLLSRWRIRPFDPYPFGLLTLIVSLEAIFLSTFVLISQNNLAHTSEREAAMDLQINLLAEQQAVKIIEMLEQMIEQMNAMDNSFHVALDPQLMALKHAPTPQEVAQAIEEQTKQVVDQAADKAATKAVDKVAEQVAQLENDIEPLSTAATPSQAPENSTEKRSRKNE